MLSARKYPKRRKEKPKEELIQPSKKVYLFFLLPPGQTQPYVGYIRKEERGRNDQSFSSRNPTSMVVHSVVDRVVDRGLGLFLLGPQKRAHPGQRIGRNQQACVDEGLSDSKEPIPATLLILVPVRVEDVMFAIVSNPDRQSNVSGDLVLQGLGVLHDDGKGVVESREALVTERVGLFEVRSNDAIWP